MSIKSYKDLDVWNKGIQIVELVYKLTKYFPKQEQFVLSTQMKRSAISIPSNIAEGFARFYTKEYKQFCSIALASCSELETQSIIAQRLGYISKDNGLLLEEHLDHESRMLMNLIKSLAMK